MTKKNIFGYTHINQTKKKRPGKHSKKLHEKLATVINSSTIDNVHVYGRNIKHTFKKIIQKKKGLILREI